MSKGREIEEGLKQKIDKSGVTVKPAFKPKVVEAHQIGAYLGFQLCTGYTPCKDVLFVAGTLSITRKFAAKPKRVKVLSLE